MEKAALQLDIIIVGAGIGGLATAHALGKAGHHVTVIESAAALSEIGAGIQIGPNMSRILIRWGLKTLLDNLAVKPCSVSLYDTGERVGFAHFGERMAKEFGAPYYHVHRADLLSMLYEAATPYMKLLLGVRVKCVIKSPTHPKIVLESGCTMTADLIIGADGLHSVVRQAVIHRPVMELPTGDAAYRTTIPSKLLLQDDDLRELVENPQYLCWMGPQRHIVGYCIRGRKEYNLVMIHAHDGSVPGVDIDHMRKLYDGWETRIKKLHALVEKERLVKTVLNINEPLEQWYDSTGRIVLLGDACHTMLPYRGQGSAMAVEDAAALGNLFSCVTSYSQIPTLLEAYQSIRKPRVQSIQDATWLNRDIFHLPDGEEQKARDDSMRVAMYQQLDLNVQKSGSATDSVDPVPDISPDTFDHTANHGNYNLLADQKKNIELFGYDIDLAVVEWCNQHLKASWQGTGPDNHGGPRHRRHIVDINHQSPIGAASTKSRSRHNSIQSQVFLRKFTPLTG